jgi:ACT domain-containing protein
MAKSKKTSRKMDRKLVAATQDHEVKHLAKKTKSSKKKVKEAVKKVGHSRKAVEKSLKGK